MLGDMSRIEGFFAGVASEVVAAGVSVFAPAASAGKVDARPARTKDPRSLDPFTRLELKVLFIISQGGLFLFFMQFMHICPGIRLGIRCLETPLPLNLLRNPGSMGLVRLQWLAAS